jgi:hypothetical protein
MAATGPSCGSGRPRLHDLFSQRLDLVLKGRHVTLQTLISILDFLQRSFRRLSRLLTDGESAVALRQLVLNSFQRGSH